MKGDTRSLDYGPNVVAAMPEYAETQNSHPKPEAPEAEELNPAS